jgi:hypothetical protein
LKIAINQSTPHKVLAIIFIWDIMLMPLNHALGIPMKISYIIAFFWLIVFLIPGQLIKYELGITKKYVTMLTLFSGLIILGIIGELILPLFSTVTNRYPGIYGIFLYILMIASLGLGVFSRNFNVRQLVYIFYIYVFLNIIFVLFYDSFSWLINLYFTSGYGTWDTSMARPGGLLGNANATMLHMNILLLAIFVLFNKGLLRIEQKLEIFLLIFLPILMNIIISSRGELVSTIILESFFVYSLFKNPKYTLVQKTASIIIILFAFLSFYYVGIGYLLSKYSNVQYSINRVSTMITITDQNSASTDSYLRPFIHWDSFKERFAASPLIGSGFSFGATYPFTRSADNYHNDWFRICISSGFIGLCIWLFILRKAINYGGIIMILPFLSPGLSNTFIRSSFDVACYFFVLGILINFYYNSVLTTSQDKYKI